jgi:two-component system, cell cycle sensor histidine kinase and response regulator CckA
VGSGKAVRSTGGDGESRLAAIVKSSSAAIVSTTLDGIITSWNAGAEAIFGYSAKEIIGQSALVIFPPDRVDELVPILDQIRRGGRVAIYETKRIRKDGTIIDVLVSISPIRDENGAIAGIGVVARDITERNWAEAERREAEARQREAERMESLRQLARVVGHDFSIWLSAIMNHAARVVEATADDPALHADAQQIQAVAARAARLAGELFVFSGRDPAPPGQSDLNAVLSGARHLLQLSAGEQTEVRLATASGLPFVMADPRQVEQVLVNLAVNARDAMPAGGTLTFSTGLTDLGEELDAEWPGARPGRYVELTVSDSGCGMDSQTMRHAFDPFFTTKPTGQGAGLGLSIAYGIVTKAGGGITVDSEEGAGTAFHIYLPAICVPAPAPPIRQPLVASGRGQTILVVDGQPASLEITARILRHSGYKVLEATTSDEGLSLVSSHDIELVLTDVFMPGSVVLDQALETRPGIRVLRMSGSTPGAPEPGSVTSAQVPHIRKPFIPADLLEKVRTVLAAEPERNGMQRTPGVRAARTPGVPRRMDLP